MNFRTKLTVVLSTSMLLFAACENQQTEEVRPALPQMQIPNASQLNATLYQRFAEQGVLDWKDMEDEILFGALKESYYILSVGYKRPNMEFTFEEQKAFAYNEPSWQAARTQVVEDIANYMNANEIPLPEQLLLNITPQFANMELFISDIRVLNFVRKHPLVRYAEANFYEPDFSKEVSTEMAAIEEPCLYDIAGEPCFPEEDTPIVPGPSYSCNTEVHLDEGGAGCGYANPETLHSGDFNYIFSGSGTGYAKKSWVLNAIGMTDYAWAQGNAGAGIGVALIDTGISPNQCNLAYPGFNSGGSISTRKIVKKATYGTNPDDICGHGTTMAGLIAAPRTGNNTIVGAAYNCDLYSYRANEDAFINVSSQVASVAAAINDAADNEDINIISMSMGSTFWKSTIAEAIKKAYYNGKIIVCAAGTIDGGLGTVIFPANMAVTVAVTGRKSGTSTVPCDRCFYGDKVDFSVPMQRNWDVSRTAPTLAEWGNNSNYVSGSSSATAITAGVFAVLWAAHPNESSYQIRQRLIRSAENQDHSDEKFGYGNYNVDVAIR